MYSTENNLNNPNNIIDVRLEPKVKSKKERLVKYVNQSYYNRIAIPEPFTCYIITDSIDGRFYIGDKLILPNENNIKYLMTINPNNSNNWDIFMNFHDRLILIATYDNLQLAAKELNELIIKGNYGSIRCKIYNKIKSYIQDNISIEDSIIGIIIDLGIVNDNPELQDLMRLLFRFRNNYKSITNNKLDKDISITLNHLSDKYPNSIYNLFNRILDIFVYNSFFKEYIGIDDYNNPYNLGEAIDMILKTFTIWRTI